MSTMDMTPSFELELHGDLRDLVDDLERYIDVFGEERPLRIIAHHKHDDIVDEYVKEAVREEDEDLREYAKQVVLRCVAIAEGLPGRVAFMVGRVPQLGRREHLFVQFVLLYKDKESKVVH
jgi:hypothetical protein